MSHPFLSVRRIVRELATGNTEELPFEAGVNLLVGRPNTGKTRWLQTLDYLLGDQGENPFQGADEAGLADKYAAASAELMIGEEPVLVQRRWREAGSKTKLFIGDQGMSAAEFQHWLMTKLGIPLLHFPKGNPMSGQTWPELSFRTILRHIYRQQRFWTDLADKQPEGDQHACLLQFLGLAEHLFTESYGELVRLKLEVERLKARREQYAETLQELAGELVSEPGLTIGINTATVQGANERLTKDIEHLLKQRAELLAGARDRSVPAAQRDRVAELSTQRAGVIVGLEELRVKTTATAERLNELRRYRGDLAEELERMSRADDAASVLADLKITHCPACDQPVSQPEHADPNHCFLCHQGLADEPLMEELGAVRLQFERERLTGESKEGDELISILELELKGFQREIELAEEKRRSLEHELAPSREAVSALVQADLSAIDRTLGEISERQRQRQLSRLSAALETGNVLTKRIGEIEEQIAPLQRAVDEAARKIDFEAAASALEGGMNEYFGAINKLRPRIWRHSPVQVRLSRYDFRMRVGNRRWHDALGGTDTLYFLMAYHYGLLTLSPTEGMHYPGLAIIDVPGELSGEAIEDKENFIVQPFIDLLKRRPPFNGAQLIITGASFAGLQGVNRHTLTHVYVA
jgi:hypothetical protein